MLLLRRRILIKGISLTHNNKMEIRLRVSEESCHKLHCDKKNTLHQVEDSVGSVGKFSPQGARYERD